MSYWPWWASGLALAAVMVGNWLLLRQMMAVSGRYTAIVDGLRRRLVERGHDDDADAEMTPEELAEAVRAVTAQEFGEQALEARQPVAPPPLLASRSPISVHTIFFGGLLLGGLASSLLAGTWAPSMGLHGERFAALVRHSPLVTPLVLLFGGVCIGFGTRMATGCTSGHALCGVSRFRPASILATCAFFATGVGASFILERLL